MRADLDAFLRTVEANYGQPALLYVTPEFLQAYRDYLPARSLWRRSIIRMPDDTTPWRVWQFRNRGQVAGIRGAIDLNVYHGDAASFARWSPSQRDGPETTLHTPGSGEE